MTIRRENHKETCIYNKILPSGKRKVLENEVTIESRRERSEEAKKWAKMYKNKRYQRARKIFMIRHPFCAVCGKPAEHLDHIIPHKGDYNLFWDRSNWQSLCASCHSKKTIREMNGKEDADAPSKRTD